MYCHYCGKELSGPERFCPYCGTARLITNQNTEQQPTQQPIEQPVRQTVQQPVQQPIEQPAWQTVQQPVQQPIQQTGWQTVQQTADQKNPGANIKIGKTLVGIFAILLVVLGVWGFANSAKEKKQKQTEEYEQQLMIQVQEMKDAKQNMQKEGWVEEDGNRYYYIDNQFCVGLQEIDGDLYCFDKNGSLLVSGEMQLEDYMLAADAEGMINAVTYDVVGGAWAEEVYSYGNNGKSPVMELYTKMEDCESFTFCLEAEGQYGVKVNGSWNVCIRNDGVWEKVGTVEFTAPKSSVELIFEEPKTFDAITAYPAFTGNISYQALFYLTDVHCLYQDTGIDMQLLKQEHCRIQGDVLYLPNGEAVAAKDGVASKTTTSSSSSSSSSSIIFFGPGWW